MSCYNSIEEFYGNLSKGVTTILDELLELAETYFDHNLRCPKMTPQEIEGYENQAKELESLKKMGLENSINYKKCAESIEYYNKVKEIRELRHQLHKLTKDNLLLILGADQFADYLRSRTRGKIGRIMDINSFKGELGEKDIERIREASNTINEYCSDDYIAHRYNSFGSIYHIFRGELKNGDPKLFFAFGNSAEVSYYRIEDYPLFPKEEILPLIETKTQKLAGRFIEDSQLLIATDGEGYQYIFNIYQKMIFLWHVIGDTSFPQYKKSYS